MYAIVTIAQAAGAAAEQFELPVPAPVAIGVAFVACVGTAAWLAHHSGRVRGREAKVRAAARRLGLTYHGADARGMARPRFAIYENAEVVNVSHQVSGRTRGGSAVVAYDFSGARDVPIESDDASRLGRSMMIGGSNESLRTKRVSTGTFATAAVAEVTAYFPELLVSPQGAMRRMVNNVTGADIKFESSEFNRLFQVTAENEGFARLFLNPRILDMLVTAEGAIGLETFGRSVVLFGEEVASAQVPALAMMVGEVVENLDPIVIREYPPPDLVVPGELRRPFLS